MDAWTQPLHCDGERLSKGNCSPPLLRNEVIHADHRHAEPLQQRFDAVSNCSSHRRPTALQCPLA